jgi:N-acetylmuramate 1-kinase
MSDLRPELERYLERACPGGTVEPIAGDASARSFYRVSLPQGATCIVMDYGGPFDGETDDARLARVFDAAGLRVAKILDSCADVGCLLLEDLGDVMLESAIARPGGGLRPEAREWIERAVRLAALVAERGSAALARSERREAPSLNAVRFRFEMDYFMEHFLKGLLGCTSFPDRLREELYDLAERAAATPQRVLCHRDFHSRNLMVLPDGELAMVDIQDARWGPDTYDLASLLRDAYVDIDQAWDGSMIELYLSSLSEPPGAASFRERFDSVTTQRMIKALGTFGYQAGALGRARYLEAIPRTLARLERSLQARDEARVLLECLREAGAFRVR